MKIEIPKFWQCPSCQEAIRPWKTVGIGLLAILVLAWFWNREHRFKTDALREAEAARLALAQQIVAAQDSAKDVQASMADLLMQNDLLKEAYEQALKAAPDAKPESTAKLVTQPAQIIQVPRPAPTPQAPEIKPAQCMLAAGDTGSFRVDEIVLGTKAGNKLVTGTAEFWRETPVPRARLAAGKFVSSLSDVATVAPPAPPRWGAELAGLCTVNGCGLGAGVLLPPFRVPLFGWQGEARLTAFAGPSLALSGGLGVRW